MNEVEGVVVRIEQDQAWVRVAGAGSACGSCSSRGSCGTGGLLVEDSGPKLLRLPNTIQARSGDQVLVRAADGVVMRAVWQAYIAPLMFALGLTAILLELTGNEAIALAGMFAGLVAGFLALRFRKSRRQGVCDSQTLSISLKNS